MFKAVKHCTLDYVPEHHRVPGTSFLVDAFKYRCKGTAATFRLEAFTFTLILSYRRLQKHSSGG